MNTQIVEDSEQRHWTVSFSVSASAPPIFDCADRAHALKPYATHQPGWVVNRRRAPERYYISHEM